MPITTVFKINGGGLLQQIQLGAADIVATLGAAQSAWGWVGGLAGVARVLSFLKNDLQRDPFRSLRLKEFIIPSARCHILTTGGMLYFDDNIGDDAFGGDPLLKSIGFIICALEHECGGLAAVNLFVRNIVVCLNLEFGTRSVPALEDCLYQQLVDHLPAIINEGATRNLRDIFLNAAADLPPATRPWHFSPELGTDDSGRIEHNELSLLGKFLQWTTETYPDTHYTRSSLTARNAAYLKAIGYPIGLIVVWDGKGDPPEPRPHGLVLVIGGTFETDASAFTRVQTVLDDSTSLKLYYRQDTIGSMFVHALRANADFVLESIQEMFVYVRSRIRDTLSCSWEVRPKADRNLTSTERIAGRDGLTLDSIFRHKKPSKKLHSLSTRIASTYFKLLAEMVATCYDPIATKKHLDCIRGSQHDDPDLEYSTDLAWFRIFTAYVVYTIAEMLAKEGFDSLSHVTQMSLDTPEWLDSIVSRLDKLLGPGIPFYEAVWIISTVHVGITPESISWASAESSVVLGYRNGSYAVLPALLASMAPTKDSIGIFCFDRFIANIRMAPTGARRKRTYTSSKLLPAYR